MPIACLALAALAALAFDRVRVPASIAILLVAADLHVRVYGASAAGPGGRAYAAMAGPGRLLELPILTPDIHLGSVYLLYDMSALRERPGGYSTLAPRRADEIARSLQPLNVGEWTEGRAHLLRSLGVHFIAVHEGVYRQAAGVTLADADRASAALRAHGWRLVARDGAVKVYTSRT